MGNYNPEDYEPVESRIKRFYADHPKGSIRTELLSDPNHLDTAVVMAYLYDDYGEILLSTGMAFEQIGQGFVNKTSHLENAETSAIGRALANYNYSGDKRPSREEMAKTQGNPTKPSTEPHHDDPQPSGGQSEDLFQKIAANKDKLKPEIGKVMNRALKARTEGNIAELEEIVREFGI